MPATIAQATIKATATISSRHDLGGDFFYTQAPGGMVTLWHGEPDCNAIALAKRHPGTSGKDAATIARDLLAGA